MPSQETPTWLRAERSDSLTCSLSMTAILAKQEGVSDVLLLTAAEAGSVHHGSWFWRLARARARPGQGALSRALAGSSEEERCRVHNALGHLPAEIGLMSDWSR
jgi:hypothetical protein